MGLTFYLGSFFPVNACVNCSKPYFTRNLAVVFVAVHVNIASSISRLVVNIIVLCKSPLRPF